MTHAKPILVAVAVLGLLAASLFAFSTSSKNKKQIVSSTKTENCVASSMTPPPTTNASDQASLSLVVITHLATIPAGTHADIFLKSYNGKTATGSILYAGQYGDYNFTANKTNQDQEMSSSTGAHDNGWKLTSFKVCKP